MQPDEQEAPVVRLNARDTDAFDLGNLTYFSGPEPLSRPRAALVFDLALTGSPSLPVADYVEAVAGTLSASHRHHLPDHAHLFAALVSRGRAGSTSACICTGSAVHPRGRFDRVATQALDRRTQHRVGLFRLGLARGDRRGRRFDHAAGWRSCRRSSTARPIGGPTTYALLRAAERATSRPSICATRA